jgi:UDP-glucose 4-epimerase
MPERGKDATHVIGAGEDGEIQYIAAGHEIAVVDNLWAEGGGKEGNLNPQARFYRADIINDTELAQIFDEVKPEIVNHHAAQHSVAVSTRDPQLDARVNVLGLLNVLTNCTRANVRKIIFASSGASYGTPAHLPLNEECTQFPESPYGITKMVAEHSKDTGTIELQTISLTVPIEDVYDRIALPLPKAFIEYRKWDTPKSGHSYI